MKKYSIPNTEAITMIMGSVICDESAGRAMINQVPNPESNTPTGAPRRASVLYI